MLIILLPSTFLFAFQLFFTKLVKAREGKARWEAEAVVAARRAGDRRRLPAFPYFLILSTL